MFQKQICHNIFDKYLLMGNAEERWRYFAKNDLSMNKSM